MSDVFNEAKATFEAQLSEMGAAERERESAQRSDFAWGLLFTAGLIGVVWLSKKANLTPNKRGRKARRHGRGEAVFPDVVTLNIYGSYPAGSKEPSAKVKKRHERAALSRLRKLGVKPVSKHRSGPWSYYAELPLAKARRVSKAMGDWTGFETYID